MISFQYVYYYTVATYNSLYKASIDAEPWMNEVKLRVSGESYIYDMIHA